MLYIVLWYVITLHILFIYSLLSSILFYAYAKEKKIKDYVKGYVEYQWNGKILYYTIRMFYFSLHSLHSGVSFQYSIVIQMRWNMYMILGWSKVSHIREALISNKLLDKEAAIENKWITNIYSTCQQTLLFWITLLAITETYSLSFELVQISENFYYHQSRRNRTNCNWTFCQPHLSGHLTARHFKIKVSQIRRTFGSWMIQYSQWISYLLKNKYRRVILSQIETCFTSFHVLFVVTCYCFSVTWLLWRFKQT